MGFDIQTVVHPTDLSDLSSRAFAHGLRICVAVKGRLHLVHVSERDDIKTNVAFPHVPRLLAQWGFIQDNEPPSTPAQKLGIQVSNISVHGYKPVDGILNFLDQHACDVVVLATHGRDGLDRWTKGSVAESVFRRSAVPTLFVPASARGFVSQVSGDIALRRILIPIDHSPSPARAVEVVERFARLVGATDVVMHLLHIGSSAPVLYGTLGDIGSQLPVMLRSGNVVKSILDAAVEFDVDLIGMPTAGHQGILDALRGSTTERVLRHAPCPLLAISAI